MTTRSGHLGAMRADRALHRRLGVPRRRSLGVLRRGQPEEQHAADAVGPRRLRLA